MRGGPGQQTRATCRHASGTRRQGLFRHGQARGSRPADASGYARGRPGEDIGMDETQLPPEGAPSQFPGVGDLVGPYRLERALDAGGMGVVYVGRRVDGSFEQQVAIKLVRPQHLQADAGFAARLIQRFEAERSLLARLVHPNIARILDGGSTAGGLPWLAMEYVEHGLSLTLYCARRALDVDQRLALFAKVCDGVQAAHAHLVVHRDLKPDNILVGSDGEPKLLDFGIATLLRTSGPADEAGTGTRGQTELLALTPAYASPEQILQQPPGVASDVYSLGVVLYELLSGSRPYELAGLRPSEVERLVCEVEPPRLGEMLARAPSAAAAAGLRAPRISRDLERILARALHKDPQRRYRSADALAEDLRRLRAGLPVAAAPDTRLYRLRRFLGRHRFGSAAAVLALLAVLGSAGIALQQASQARRAASDLAEVNAFLQGVLSASDPFESGRGLTLAEAVDAAAADLQRFDGRPQISAALRHSLGYSQLARNQLESAALLLERGLVDSLQGFGEHAEQTLQLREAIAQLRFAQGRTDEGEAELVALVRDIETHGLQSMPIHLVALNNLGVHHLMLGHYAEAEPWLLRAQEAQSRQSALDHSARNDRANLTANLAQVAHGLGQLDRAEALYAEAEAQLAELFPEGGPDVAILLNNRALLALDRGASEQALQLLRQSLAMREAVFDGDHPLVLGAMVSLGRHRLRFEDPAEAEALAARASGMAQRLGAGSRSMRVHALLLWTRALSRLGRVAEADARLIEAEVLLESEPTLAEQHAQDLTQQRAALCAEATGLPGCLRQR